MTHQDQSSARVVVLAEGEYDVPLSQDGPVKLSELLDGLGISNRHGQLFLNGSPVAGDPIVEPGSETLLMPHIRGG
jgi:hypothetical protein